jgi:hypothetical protein
MAAFSTYKPSIGATNYPTLWNGAMDELDSRFTSTIETTAGRGFRALSGTYTPPSTSKGLELYYDGSGDFASVLSIDRTGVDTYKTLRLNGSAVQIYTSGTLVANCLTDTIRIDGHLGLIEGQVAPAAVPGYALIYIDTADGDLKCRFGDGVTKTLQTDT